MSYTREQIAAALDLAVLKPTATIRDVIRAGRLVQKEGIATICVAPCNVALAKRYTDRVCAVIGFPHGNTTPEVKQYEARQAIANGAIELDVVCNLGRFLDGKCDREWLGLGSLIYDAYAARRMRVKAILETGHLSPRQIANLCKVCVRAGADFVKTSTGFGPEGATVEAVKIMVEAVKGRAEVKASGGIKTYADAARYLDLGCTRIGASVYKELLPCEG